MTDVKNLKVLGDGVLLRKIVETQSAGGILIPEEARRDSKLGIVVAIGSEVETIKVRDQIFYGGADVEEFKIDGDTLYLIREYECVAKVIS